MNDNCARGLRPWGKTWQIVNEKLAGRESEVGRGVCWENRVNRESIQTLASHCKGGGLQAGSYNRR
jgi:hypothetical protein